MTKIEVISQKPSKNWIFGKNDHFLTVFGPKRAKNVPSGFLKKIQIWAFFGQKLSKNGHFCQKSSFLKVFVL